MDLREYLQLGALAVVSLALIGLHLKSLDLAARTLRGVVETHSAAVKDLSSTLAKTTEKTSDQSREIAIALTGLQAEITTQGKMASREHEAMVKALDQISAAVGRRYMDRE